MIRELPDTELESVAGGFDFGSPYVTLNNVGNVQLNIQPQIATSVFGNAQNVGGLLANLNH
jgi:hypothetical protein